MLFNYKFSDKNGKIVKSTIEANDANDARNQLSLKDGMLLSLEAAEEKKKKKHKKASTSPKKKKKGDITIGHIKLLEKVMLAKHLSIMIKSGMAIDGALEVLMDNAKPLMAKRIETILEDVRKGNAFSTALKKHPKDFDTLFINMVQVGESGGTLAKNLDLLSIQQQKNFELTQKLKAAAMYPAIVMIAIIILMVVISAFVLPKITGFFSTLKITLPLSTRIFLGIADFFGNNWLLIIIFVIGLVVGLKVMSHIKPTRYLIHKTMLKLPLIGGITKNMNLALFSRTLASLLDSGITIDRSLQIVAKTLTNDVYKKQIQNIYHNVLKGSSLADSLNDKTYFPIIMSRMSRVGERSGNLSEVLDYLANFYESEVDHTTKNLSTILEPALLIFIGLVVGFVAMSIINPIYQLTSRVGS